MSVTAHSPYLGHKRLHGETDSPDHQGSLSPKRLRAFSGSPPPACARRERRSYKFGRTTVAALRSLFPGMDEKVVVQVLDSCGSNIDEAIKRLGNLQLSMNGSANGSAHGADSHAATPPAFPSPPLSPPPEPRREAGGPSEAGPGPGSSGAAEPEEPQKTPVQWVEGLVQQMSAARNLQDARVRAAQELRAFEQAVIQSTNKARQADVLGLQAKLTELSKENHVLKRAVAIQQSRWQEAVSANKQQGLQAEGIISQLQSKVHALEMSNYSLSMHLRQATGSAQPDVSHPDVF